MVRAFAQRTGSWVSNLPPLDQVWICISYFHSWVSVQLPFQLTPGSWQPGQPRMGDLWKEKKPGVPDGAPSSTCMQAGSWAQSHIIWLMGIWLLAVEEWWEHKLPLFPTPKFLDAWGAPRAGSRILKRGAADGVMQHHIQNNTRFHQKELENLLI